MNNRPNSLWTACALVMMVPQGVVSGETRADMSERGETGRTRHTSSPFRHTPQLVAPCGRQTLFPTVPSPYSYNLFKFNS